MREAVLLVLLACNAKVDCEGRYTASGFTESEMREVQGAAAKWRTFSGRDVRIIEGEGDVCHISTGTPPRGLTGWHSGQPESNIVIRIEPDMCLSEVVMHEIGHAFGLRHVSLGIMRDGGPCVGDFSEEDKQECKAAGVCG